MPTRIRTLFAFVHLLLKQKPLIQSYNLRGAWEKQCTETLKIRALSRAGNATAKSMGREGENPDDSEMKSGIINHSDNCFLSVNKPENEKTVGISTQEQHSTWTAPMSQLRALKHLFCFVFLCPETFNSPKSTSGILPGLSGSPQHKLLSLHFWCLDFTSGLQKTQRRKENKKHHPFSIIQSPAACHISPQDKLWHKLIANTLSAPQGFTALAERCLQVSKTLSLCTLFGRIRGNPLGFTVPARPMRHSYGTQLDKISSSCLQRSQQ